MNRATFFAVLRRELRPKLSAAQVEGIEAILDATQGLPERHRAYILATAWHETASTMQPIAEYGNGKGRSYGKPGKYGQAQYGRGYVQLTWDRNYEKADQALGLGGALLKNFDLAMKPDIAARILVRGSVEGWFTGKKLGDYSSFKDMRRVINGTDRDDLIAEYAEDFLAALAEAGAEAETRPVEAPKAPPAVEVPQQPLSLWSVILRVAAAMLRKGTGK